MSMEIIAEEAAQYLFFLYFVGICGGLFVGGAGHAVKSVIHIFEASAK